MNLTYDELGFIKECLGWSVQEYEEKSFKYRYKNDPDGEYHRTIYLPLTERYKKIQTKLTNMRKEIKNK